MRTTPLLRVPALFLLTLASGLPAAAQRPVPKAVGRVREDAALTYIKLGVVSGIPGDLVAVPIDFKPGKDTHVRLLYLTVEFTEGQVHFDKLERAKGIDKSRMDMAVDNYAPSQYESGEPSKLGVRIASVTVKGDEALPTGTLGYLYFRIDSESDGRPLFLDVSAEATEAGSNGPMPIEKIRTQDGTVYVELPGAVPGCFFFTH